MNKLVGVNNPDNTAELCPDHYAAVREWAKRTFWIEDTDGSCVVCDGDATVAELAVSQ